MTKKILILGTLPQPIGGVTIYCKRLLEYLEILNIKHTFVDFKRVSKLFSLSQVSKYKFIHIHTSNSFFRFFVILFARILRKKIFFTFHGNIGRYGYLKNYCDLISIMFANKVYVINESSYIIAKKYNLNTELTSAFLKPIQTESLNSKLNLAITEFVMPYNQIFCTNATNVTFDKNNNEVYQISHLINIFSRIKNKALIFSDPTSSYTEFLKKENISIPPNVFVINEKHDFFEILKLSHCLIRYTTTDGDSISVKEALSLGKQVIASDVVSRPYQVTLVSDLLELEQNINNFNNNISVNFNEDSFKIISKFYNDDLS